MSLGLPSHVAPRALNRALERAGHAIALAALISATFIVLAFAAYRTDLLLWPALLTLTCMLIALWWVDRVRTIAAAISYLAIGAVGTYVYVLVFSSQLPNLVESSVLWFALPKVALIMAAGVSAGAFQAVGWALIGYILAELASLIALSQVGVSSEFDIVAFGTFGAATVVTLLAFLATNLAHKSQPRLHRAARDELLDDIRSRMELLSLIHI